MSAPRTRRPAAGGAVGAAADGVDGADGSVLPDPLLGEWACLGVLCDGRAHGFAVAKRLRPDGDVGRVWHLTRPLTYRSLDRLIERGWIVEVGEEAGDAGPNRRVLGPTRIGRNRLRSWLRTPVAHLRDLRGELLLKLVLADLLDVDVSEMLDRQRGLVDERAAALEHAAAEQPGDVVTGWRLEMTRAARRFLDR